MRRRSHTGLAPETRPLPGNRSYSDHRAELRRSHSSRAIVPTIPLRTSATATIRWRGTAVPPTRRTIVGGRGRLVAGGARLLRPRWEPRSLDRRMLAWRDRQESARPPDSSQKGSATARSGLPGNRADPQRSRRYHRLSNRVRKFLAVTRAIRTRQTRLWTRQYPVGTNGLRCSIDGLHDWVAESSVWSSVVRDVDEHEWRGRDPRASALASVLARGPGDAVQGSGG